MIETISGIEFEIDCEEYFGISVGFVEFKIGKFIFLYWTFQLGIHLAYFDQY